MEKNEKQDSVLAVLASKEKTIEALRRELAEKKSAVEQHERREGKLKGQVVKLKTMIQPLGDELVNQKKELEQVKSEVVLQRGEVEAKKEEVMGKCRMIDKQKKEVATLEMKLKEVEKKKEMAIEVERGKMEAMEEMLKNEQKENQEKVEMLQNKVKKAEEASLQHEMEKLQFGSNAAKSEKRAQELEAKLHQSEERATTLSEELEKQTLEKRGQLRKLEEGLPKLEEMLTLVKAECAEVKRNNSILEENILKKQKQMKSLKKKLSAASKSNIVARRRKKRKLNQDQDESLAKQANIVQEGNNNCLKMEPNDLKVNLTREEDVAETASADDAGAETVDGEKGTPMQDEDVVVSISDEEVLYITSDEEEQHSEQVLVSEELEGTVPKTEPQALDHVDPTICSSSNLSHTSPSTSGPSHSSTLEATLSPISSRPLDISGSPPQLHTQDIPPSSEPLLRLRDLKSLVELPSQGAPTESKTERVMSLKHEMKHQVELVLRKYYHKSEPHVYSQKSWEIFDDEDFAEVCRMLAVQAREEVLKRWGLQGDSQEDLWILEEDIARMRASVDFFFYIRKEFAQRLSTLLSLQDPFYMKELHAASSLLFSLLPTFNFNIHVTKAFDFYFDFRNAVSNYSQTLGIDLKPQQELTLKLFRDLVESHDLGGELVLDNGKKLRIWEVLDASRLAAEQEM